MATLSPSDGLAAGATFWCESAVGEVGSVEVWSKLLAVVGVTGLVGWLAELLGSPSLVRFFLRKPRLGMKTLRSGAQVVQTQEVGRKRGGPGTEARTQRRHGGHGGGGQGRGGSGSGKRKLQQRVPLVSFVPGLGQG